MSAESTPKTKAGKPRKKMGRPPKSSATRKGTLLRLRATEEYAIWVKGLAEHTGNDISALVDLGLMKVARETRYPVPAPPR